MINKTKSAVYETYMHDVMDEIYNRMDFEDMSESEFDRKEKLIKRKLRDIGYKNITNRIATYIQENLPEYGAEIMYDLTTEAINEIYEEVNEK